MQRIGFIGMGLMGRPMSQALLRAGFPVTVWNRTRGKAAEVVAAGAAWAGSPAEVAAASEVVIAMVTDAARFFRPPACRLRCCGRPAPGETARRTPASSSPCSRRCRGFRGCGFYVSISVVKFRLTKSVFDSMVNRHS